MINQDIIFIRHAQSQYNIASHQCRQKNNIPYIWEQLSKSSEFMDGVKYNPAFIDCSITEKGKQQCTQARQQQISKLQPDLILVSPLERCLQTCSLVFKGRNIPTIVEPSLAQSFRGSCDIGSELSGKKKRFPTYDFTSAQKQGDLWFVKNDCEENQEKYFSHLKELNLQNHEAITKEICKFMRTTLLYEAPPQMNKRAERVRNMLREYKKKYNTIAVVSHYAIINHVISNKSEFEGLPNCGVKKVHLEDLSDQ